MVRRRSRFGMFLAAAALLAVVTTAAVHAYPGYFLVSCILPWESGYVQVFNAYTGELVTTLPFTDDFPTGLALGPDGNVYVSAANRGEVRRFQGPTGASPWEFVDTFVPQAANGGLTGAEGCIFGPDGNLYVVAETSYVMRYNGTTGAFIDRFIARYAGDLSFCRDIAFGPDGNAYVGSWNGHNIKRYDGTTGAYIDDFVTAGSGGLTQPFAVKFHGDYLYVTSRMTNSVKRYDATTGAYVGDFVASGSGGLSIADDFDFGQYDALYVVGQGMGAGGHVKRYSTSGFYLDDFGTYDPAYVVYHCLYIPGTDPAPPLPPGSVPESMTYQGRLTDASGTPVPDGSYALQFKFYNALAGGDLLWASPSISVQTDGGIFTARIENIPAKDVFPNGNVWMEIAVEGETLPSPRTKIDSVPFALRAGS